MLEGRTLADTAASLAAEKKAEDIVILDLRGISTITDYFVVCSGTSQPHLKAILKEVRERLKNDHDTPPMSTEGQSDSQWMVIDYGDVMVHLFHPERRQHFALEDLWGDAERILWAPPSPADTVEA